ncbi:unnamed protein product [Pleuronectes platessa]|uniref:Uncharacterized protein n=1 Tax=Pleuronectes platessa TaxID=8262 RepID=A0A9N7VAA1_PLEPL|nr:unnamed protein product [Pleuronectes platessa]
MGLFLPLRSQSRERPFSTEPTPIPHFPISTSSPRRRTSPYQPGDASPEPETTRGKRGLGPEITERLKIDPGNGDGEVVQAKEDEDAVNDEGAHTGSEDLLLSPRFLLTLHTLPHPSSLTASLSAPWLGTQLLSPQTPHIPALPWLPACIPGHGDSMGSHNPRQLADLGWATDSQRQGRAEKQRG